MAHGRSGLGTQKAAASFNAGTLLLIGSTVTGNLVEGTSPTSTLAGGGGIFNQTPATLELQDSTVSNNQATSTTDCAGGGGGIWNQNGTLTISGSTISGNLTNGDGGGVHHVNSTSNPLTITNSTISGNTATGSGGGVFVNFRVRTAALVHTTVTQNTASTAFNNGGLGGSGATTNSMTLTNSLLGGNTPHNCVPGSGARPLPAGTTSTSTAPAAWLTPRT